MRYNKEDYPIMEVYGRERRAIEHLAVFNIIGKIHGDALSERLHKIPHGWRDYQLLRSLAQKLADEISLTLPQKDWNRLDRLTQRGECVIRPQSVVSREYVMVSVDDLDYVALRAIHEGCALCVKDGGEIRSCKLRRALMQVIPLGEKPKFGCGYRDYVDEIKED